MLDTVKINHVQHISFTQSRLTDAVSVILSELLSYEHPSKAGGLFLLCPMSHGVPQETGTAGHLLVIVGGEPLIHHIELRDPAVLGGIILLPGDGEPPAVEGGDLLALIAFRGHTFPDGGRSLAHHLVIEACALAVAVVVHRPVGGDAQVPAVSTCSGIIIS